MREIIHSLTLTMQPKNIPVSFQLHSEEKTAIALVNFQSLPRPTCVSQRHAEFNCSFKRNVFSFPPNSCQKGSCGPWVKQDLMVRLKCPIITASEKAKPRGKNLTTLMLKEAQQVCFILFSNQNLRLGNPLKLARYQQNTCWFDRKKKRVFTQKSNKGFLSC